MSPVVNPPRRREPRALSIAKLMMAVAWAPGRLAHEDLLKIKQHLNAAGVNKREDIKQALHLYQEYPIDPMERRRLARQFAHRYSRAEDRKEVVEILDGLLSPKENPPVEKILAIQEIKEALVEDQINFIKKVQYKLTRTPFPAVVGELGREAYLTEYLANPIFFRLKLRFGNNFRPIDLTPKRAEKLSLELAFISLTAYADQILLPEELGAISDYLNEKWGLPEARIEMLITMALCREANEGQVPGFGARYRELASFDDRLCLYQTLGKIARVDKWVTRSEQNVLEIIAQHLDIPVGMRQAVFQGAEGELVEVE